MAGWLHLWKGEYRYDSEDPPLWNTLAAAITGPHNIQTNLAELDWSNMPLAAGPEYHWEILTLFRNPNNNPIAFLQRFRAVMLAVAVALVVFLACFVWRMAIAWHATPLAAAAATLLATALFALDPNFLAHSPLMKNDVASALALLGLTASTWAAGRSLTLLRVFALAIWSGIAMTVKFNGALLIESSAALLLFRAISPWPWTIELPRTAAWRCASRARRLQVVAATLLVMGAISFMAIWLTYGMCFAPSNQPGSQMNMSRLADAALIGVWEAKHWDGTEVVPPTKEQMASMSRPLVLQFVTWANKHRILPQAFLAGLLYVFQASQTRATFLCGQSSNVGTWWYFPFAMAVKTPIATLAAFVATAIFALFGLSRLTRKPATAVPPTFRIETWTALCLAVPIAIYISTAMMSNLNLGLRHVFPIYPLLFAAVGLAMAKLWDRHKTTAAAAGLIVITGLAIESCAAYPNYIPFFNAFAGGSRGGLRLLSDSNLDWGQDLPLLAAWQRSHPDQKLYLAYFGTADPAYYGIRYTNVADGYSEGPPAQHINSPGVFAISATTLQGPYCGQTLGKPTWCTLWKLKPFEVLGGSIYLFHVPSGPDDRLPRGESLIDE